MNYSFYDEQALGKAYDLRLIRRLLPYLKRHPVLLSLSFGMVPVRAFLDLVPALVLATVVATLQDQPASGGLAWLTRWLQPPAALSDQTTTVLLWLAGAFFFSQLLWISAELVRMLSTRILGQRALRTMRADLFSHVQRLPMAFFDRYPVGRLVTRLTNDIENTSEMFTSGVIHMVADLIMMAGYATILLIIDWRLALIALAIVPPLALIAVLFRYRMRNAFREARVKVARLNAHLQETITGMKIIQLFARERRNLEELRSRHATLATRRQELAES